MIRLFWAFYSWIAIFISEIIVWNFVSPMEKSQRHCEPHTLRVDLFMFWWWIIRSSTTKMLGRSNILLSHENDEIVTCNCASNNIVYLSCNLPKHEVNLKKLVNVLFTSLKEVDFNFLLLYFKFQVQAILNMWRYVYMNVCMERMYTFFFYIETRIKSIWNLG